MRGLQGTWRNADLEAFAALNADPRVMEFFPKPLSREESDAVAARIRFHFERHGYGLWAVEERATGEFLGRIGCLNPEGFPAFEIAYTLAPWAWGKGYAREGAAAALRYARETLGRTEITSIIRPANAASIRVALSLGAVASESVEFFGAPSVIYRYPSV